LKHAGSASRSWLGTGRLAGVRSSGDGLDRIWQFYHNPRDDNPERQSRARETKQENPPSARLVVWIASSKDDLSALPRQVKASFGSRLFELQHGATPLDLKPLTRFGTGVYELRQSFDRNAY
jgi:hypothetical protein